MLYVLNKGAHAVTALGQDRWIFAKLLFFSVFMDRDGVEVQYSAILTKQAWSIKDLLTFTI